MPFQLHLSHAPCTTEALWGKRYFGKEAFLSGYWWNKCMACAVCRLVIPAVPSDPFAGILSCPALPQTYSAPCISTLYVTSLLMKNTVLCFCRDQRELSTCKWRSNIKKMYFVLDRSTALEQIHVTWKKRLLFNIAALLIWQLQNSDDFFTLWFNLKW